MSTLTDTEKEEFKASFNTFQKNYADPYKPANPAQKALNAFTSDVQGAREALPATVASFFNPASGIDRSPNTPSQAEFMSMSDAEKSAWAQSNNQKMLTGGGSGVNSGSGVSTNTAGATGGLSAVDALSAARAPRGTEFANVFGSTIWNPATGQFEQTTSEEAAGMTSGLWGQMQGVQQQLSDFDVGSAADTYLQAVMAPLAGQRAQQDQTTLSRMIASGKLGASGSARALAEQETQRGLEDLQASAFARQQALGEQSNLMSQQQTLQGLLTGVAGQQFAGQQAALEAVPLGQEIMSFPEEPQFQESMFQQQLAAQQSANNASTSASMWSALLGGIFG